MDKRHLQLGMNPSSAAHCLRMDTLFRLVQETGHVCFRCGGPLTRDTFSLEHKRPWLDSEDPKGLFFDQSNIAFSHKSCNYGAAKRPNKRFPSEVARRKAAASRHNPLRDRSGPKHDAVARRDKYLRLGT